MNSLRRGLVLLLVAALLAPAAVCLTATPVPHARVDLFVPHALPRAPRASAHRAASRTPLHHDTPTWLTRALGPSWHRADVRPVRAFRSIHTFPSHWGAAHLSI